MFPLKNNNLKNPVTCHFLELKIQLKVGKGFGDGGDVTDVCSGKGC